MTFRSLIAKPLILILLTLALAMAGSAMTWKAMNTMAYVKMEIQRVDTMWDFLTKQAAAQAQSAPQPAK